LHTIQKQLAVTGNQAQMYTAKIFAKQHINCEENGTSRIGQSKVKTGEVILTRCHDMG